MCSFLDYRSSTLQLWWRRCLALFDRWICGILDWKWNRPASSSKLRNHIFILVVLQILLFALRLIIHEIILLWVWSSFKTGKKSFPNLALSRYKRIRLKHDEETLLTGHLFVTSSGYCRFVLPCVVLLLLCSLLRVIANEKV